VARRRWIADEVSGNRAALTADHAAHLVRVLRARVGQEFDIVANAVVRRGTIASITDDRVEFDLGEEVVGQPTNVKLSLLLAIFKFDRMEWAIEKCTELGITRIVPLIAQRSDVHLVTASDKRVERWRRIAHQAAQQSRRTAPPEISPPVKLVDALSVTVGLKIVLSEAEDQIELREVRLPDDGEEVFLAVGPEGGWTKAELDLFQKGGWLAASLGPTILRAETAAIAATAITLSSLGA